ncbi:hypothetical protein NL108_017104 [Boleophthalmus pectinirostris]|uniref:uncharacterized protein LOC129411885 n=1 Tax=Boleophthalmus pectinirostris TaxID=150288 RepID=UPI00242F2407|nr:uncharacterized protein LOC129411885 [Boleophthalmus pectinirostris]KAJ0062571.1 hypothetical protein NL108_017104 [Boleophthalmus pectinirostris]
MFLQFLFYIWTFFGFFCFGSKSSRFCENNMRLRWVCAGVLDRVFVPCPLLLNSEDFSLQLLQNRTVVWTFCSPPRPNCGPAPTSPTAANQSADLAPAVILTNQSSRQQGFSVPVLDERDEGVYSCHGRSKYPPPVRTETGPEQVLVLIQGFHCGLRLNKLDSGPDQVQTLDQVWIIAVATLSIYSLFTTVSCAALWVRCRGAEEESDYVNTKPPPHWKNRR